MSSDPEDEAIAYLRHLENREWAEARAMCSEKATVWHNDGKGDATIEENISGMEAQVAPSGRCATTSPGSSPRPTKSSSNTS